MKTYAQSLLIFSTFSLFITACAKGEPDLSKKSSLFKQAFKDGCKTAKGYYTKNHKAFNNRKEYYDGWFSGRNYCNERSGN